MKTDIAAFAQRRESWKRVGLVTANAVEYDVDFAPLHLALGVLDIDSHAECWDGPAADPERYDLLLLRSTWDYASHLDAFLTWLRTTEKHVPILNPSDVVTWNTDKHYLRDLQARGIPIAPTIFIEPNGYAPIQLPNLRADVVVKPVVGGGGKDIGCFSSVSAAKDYAESLLNQGRTVMIQPYLPDIDRHGETGCVYFEGKFSHSFCKSALLRPDALPSSELFIREEITPRAVAPDERAVADATVAAFAQHLLYARVDIARGLDDKPLVLELELTEPSFFFETAPGSADRFAHAIRERLAGGDKSSDEQRRGGANEAKPGPTREVRGWKSYQ